MSESRVATLPDEAAPPDVPDAHRKSFNLVKALTLRQKGLSYDQIAELMDQPKATVFFKLKELNNVLDNPKDLQDYKDQKQAIFNIAEQRLITSLLDEACIEKASLNNRAYAFKQIHEAGRLEAGQSTSNLGVLTKHIQAVDAGLFPDKSALKTKGNSDSAENHGDVIPT